MSDSEDSTVTYTEISSPYEDLSDIGLPGAEGPIFQDPPSPDYVPGPEEPEQTPPHLSSVHLFGSHVYPEFLPRTIGPEEDPADYTADRGDDRDDEEPSDDDDDDAEEEHLAPADPATVAYSADQDPYLAYRVTARMSIRQATVTIPSPPLPIPSQPLNSPTHVEGSLGSRAAGIRQRDALPSPVHETEMPEICLPLRKRPCRTTPGPRITRSGKFAAAGLLRQVGPATARADLYGFADMLDAAPGRQPLPVPSTSRKADISEADTPPRKRLLLTTPRPGCEIGESSAAAAARQPGPTIETRLRDTERRMMTALELVNRRVTYQVDVYTRESSEFYTRHHDAQKDRAAVRAEIEVLRRERLAYEQESIETRQALARSEAYCRALEARVTVLETKARHHELQRQAADDLAVQHIMRTQALEAGAHIDTLEETSSSS
ncbi:hypothetical protein Tco_0655867 [Tanacetum coccineum]|uniref:Uncharacterized protein n=1 Tax=Tanacetum coccineum TaxID=301880 RepID=A0ABQ4X7N2_9ASTR